MTPERPRAATWARTPVVLLAGFFLLLRVWESRGLVGGYDASVYWRGAGEVIAGRDPYAVDTFVVPPTALPIIAPTGVLPERLAYAIFQISAVAAMVFGLFLLLRKLGTQARTALLVALLLVTWTSGTFQTYGFGNLNGLILLCQLLALLASTNGQERRLGLWFGLSLALKPVLAPLGLILLLQRRWTAAAWSTVIPTALLAAGTIIGGGAGFLRDSLPRLLGGFDQRFNRADLSIRAMGVRQDLPEALVMATRIVLLLAAVLVAFMVWRRATGSLLGDRRTTQLLESGSVLLIGTFLVAPFGWRYYSVFLLPWLVFLLKTRGPQLPVLHLLGWSLLLLPDSLGLQFDAAGASAVNAERPTLALVLLLAAAAADRRPRDVAHIARG